jgi:hypothetical protein
VVFEAKPRPIGYSLARIIEPEANAYVEPS